MDDGNGSLSGLFSPGQRKYLLGLEQPANEKGMKHRIRRRIQGALLDFRFLYEHHPDSEVRLTFEPSEREQWRQQLRESPHSMFDPGDEPESTSADHVVRGMKDAIAYFYRGSKARGLEDENFAELVRNAVKQAMEDQHDEDMIVEVEISIESRLRDERLEELRGKYRAGESLSADELEALLNADPSTPLGSLDESLEDAEDEGEE